MCCQPLTGEHPPAAKRAEVDQKVLANLLWLNHQRAKAEANDQPKKASKKNATKAPENTVRNPREKRSE
jgi:hypothetical protein